MCEGANNTHIGRMRRSEVDDTFGHGRYGEEGEGRERMEVEVTVVVFQTRTRAFEDRSIDCWLLVSSANLRSIVLYVRVCVYGKSKKNTK